MKACLKGYKGLQTYTNVTIKRRTGLSREARVINLRNSSQPDDIEVTEPSVLVSTSMTSFRFSLSSDNVSAAKKNNYIITCLTGPHEGRIGIVFSLGGGGLCLWSNETC